MNADLIIGIFIFGTAIGALLNSIYRTFKIEKLKANVRKEVEEEIAAIAARQERLKTAPVLWQDAAENPGKPQPSGVPAPIVPLPVKTQNYSLNFSNMTNVVNSDRRWVQVSESFASYLGRTSEEMIGKKVDDFTVPDSADVDFVFKALFQLGEMDGLWAFRHKNGHYLLVHYHAKLSSGLSYAEITPLRIA